MMTEEQKELMGEACRIIASFQSMMAGDVLEKTGTLYMSDTFQDLGTALALIGEATGDPSLPRRAVSSPETRQKLMAAYQAAELVKANAAEGSELLDICASLAACAFTVLNLAAQEGDMQQALEKAIQAAGFALSILDGVADAGPATLEPMYLNPAGQTLHGRLEQLYATFRPLVPSPAGPGVTKQKGEPDEADKQRQP